MGATDVSRAKAMPVWMKFKLISSQIHKFISVFIIRPLCSL